MPDDDTGWGGTVEDGWAPAAQPSPAPAPLSPTPPVLHLPDPPTQQRGRGRRAAVVGTALAAAAGVVVAVVLITTGGTSSKSSPPTPVTSPPITNSATPTSGGSATPTSGGSATPTAGSNAGALLARAPFSGCVAAPKASYNTPAVVDEIACTGSSVSSSVAAQGVSYARFDSQSDLNSWYSNTILKANNITQDAGNCVTGVTVNTAGGASYCEGAFTNISGTSARQLVTLSPGSIDLHNGPNSTAANCQNSSYTLLVFTSPDDNVGVVALSCTANSATARALESSLGDGSFDLN